MDGPVSVECVLASWTAHVLPGLCSGVEWARKRDLPPILAKPVVRASPALFVMQAHLAGMMRDALLSSSASSPSSPPSSSVARRHVCAQALLLVALSATECYLSLERVSRFHSRQHFVDLASMLVILRSFVRALEDHTSESSSNHNGSNSSNDKEEAEQKQPQTEQAVLAASLSEVADQSGGSSAPTALVLQQVQLVLLELACAVVVTHPTLLPLSDLPQLLQSWEAQWAQNPGYAASAPAASLPENSPTPPPPRVDFSLLSQHLGLLWDAEPFALPPAATAASAAAAASPLPPPLPTPLPSFLSSFFSMPRPHFGAASSAASASSAAGSAVAVAVAAAPTDAEITALGVTPGSFWLTQHLQLGSCSALTLLLAPLVLAHVPPSRLLRLVRLRHHLRVDDYPELQPHEDALAAQIRSTCDRLELHVMNVMSAIYSYEQ